MSGDNLLIDTNIALYLLSKDDTIAQFLEGKDIYISFITELELLGFKDFTDKEITKVKAFISDCAVIDINAEIKKHVVRLRQKYKVKLPDAIIAASAQYLGLPLMTADKGFRKMEDLNILIYEANP